MREYEGSIRQMVRGLAVATSRLAEMALAPYGVSAVDYGIMEGCLEAESITAVELSATLQADTSVISRRVNVLVEGGLVSRKRLEDDRRRVWLSLTDEGRAMTLRMAEQLRARESLMLNGIGEDERRMFVSVAERMMANVEGL